MPRPMRNGAALDECWAILPRVSRSFALPIRILPRPTGDAVMVSYLIFRIADTIEDCCPDAARRARLFERFRRLLEGDCAAVPELVALGPPPYDDLMRRSNSVAQVFSGLPVGVRIPILERVEEMSAGMQEWSAREVRSMEELHHYCYYVAGIVGKLLTRIFRVYWHVGEEAFRELDARAVEFGIALQMINVIRDVRADAAEGRRYWPSVLLRERALKWEGLFDVENRIAAQEVLRALIRDALRHCDRALEYVRHLPFHQVRVRAFCLLPLLMAVATLRECLRDPALFEAGRAVKIGRPETRRILVGSLALAPFDPLLRCWYRRLRPMI